jgi:hypothetical protein
MCQHFPFAFFFSLNRREGVVLVVVPLRAE